MFFFKTLLAFLSPCVLRPIYQFLPKNTWDFYSHCLICPSEKLLMRERETSIFIVLSIHAFIGLLFCVPWLGIEPWSVGTMLQLTEIPSQCLIFLIFCSFPVPTFALFFFLHFFQKFISILLFDAVVHRL